MTGYRERYTLDVSEIEFNQDHLHIPCRFLPAHSGDDVVRLVKSTTAKTLFKLIPQLRKELWKGELWTDGYRIATISGKGNKTVIQNLALD